MHPKGISCGAPEVISSHALILNKMPRFNPLLNRQLNIQTMLFHLSFPRKRESRKYNELWIPALRFATAGMTIF